VSFDTSSELLIYNNISYDYAITVIIIIIKYKNNKILISKSFFKIYFPLIRIINKEMVNARQMQIKTVFPSARVGLHEFR